MLVDANVLIYAANRQGEEYERAAEWLIERLNGPRRVGIPWQCVGTFLRVTTHPRIFPRPLSPDGAWEHIAGWLAAPAAWVPSPGPDYDAVLARVLAGSRASGDLVPDAMLAALAIEHGLTLQTTDTDFARFDELSWTNPLKR